MKFLRNFEASFSDTAAFLSTVEYRIPPNHAGNFLPYVMNCVDGEGFEWTGKIGQNQDRGGFYRLLDAILGTPNPDVMLVIAQGAGYFVDAYFPERCIVSGITSITCAAEVEEESYILIAAETNMLCALTIDSSIRWANRFGDDRIESVVYRDGKVLIEVDFQGKGCVMEVDAVSGELSRVSTE